MDTEEDLKNGEYRLLYIATFVLVYCIVPVIFILTNAEVNRKERVVECENQREVVELIEENEAGAYNQFIYLLDNDERYVTTLRYLPGDQVCIL